MNSGYSGAGTPDGRRVTRSPSSALSHPLFGGGSPTKIDYSKKGTLLLSSLLQDLGENASRFSFLVGLVV